MTSLNSIVLVVGCLVLSVFASSGSHYDEYLPAPGGLVHKTCIIRLHDDTVEIRDGKNNDHFIFTKSGKTIHVPECKHKRIVPHGSGWEAWSQYTNLTGLSSVVTTWTVPPLPKAQQDQTLFYWNGIEPADNSAVLQPVLQYGGSASGGGNYWAVGAWYVSSSNVFTTKLIRTAPGASILGTLELMNNGTWNVTGTNLKSGKSVSLFYTPTQEYTMAFEVLEQYNVAACNEYPPNKFITFSDIEIYSQNQKVTPKWQTLTQDPTNCKEHAVAVNSTTVEIYY